MGNRRGAELCHGNTKKNGIKRSSEPHHVCLVFFPPHVFMFTCVFVAAPRRREGVGSPGADVRCLVKCQQGWRRGGDATELWLSVGAEQTHRERGREWREGGEDCLLTGVLLTCYLALHSHTQPHRSRTQFLFTALLECNQLKVSQVLTLFITSATEMAAEKKTRINPTGRVLHEVRDYFKANWKVLRFSYSAVKRFTKR